VNESFVVSNTSSSFIGFTASIVVRGVDVIAGESRRLMYVASIYAIRLTRDLSSRFLFIL